MEGNWQATEVGLQVNLGRETATRAAKRLIMLPPFAPAAETSAHTTVESNICTKCAVSLIAARASKNASRQAQRGERGVGRYRLPIGANETFLTKNGSVSHIHRKNVGCRSRCGRDERSIKPVSATARNRSTHLRTVLTQTPKAAATAFGVCLSINYQFGSTARR
jgi:hypothetical protein